MEMQQQNQEKTSLKQVQTILLNDNNRDTCLTMNRIISLVYSTPVALPYVFLNLLFVKDYLSSKK